MYGFPVMEGLCLMVLLSASIHDARTREVPDAHWWVIGVLAIMVAAWDGMWPSVPAYAMMLAYMMRGWTACMVMAMAMMPVAAWMGCWDTVAAMAMCLFLLGMYRIGALKGGADAKALMVLAMLYPVGDTVLWPLPLPVLDVLVIALAMSLTSCIWVLARNIWHRDVHRRMFTTYRIPCGSVDSVHAWVVEECGDTVLVTPMIPFLIPVTMATALTMVL